MMKNLLSKNKISQKFPFQTLIIRNKEHILIPLGDSYCYQYFQNNLDEMKNFQYFWLYDKCKLDLAFQMVNLNVKRLTYITNTKFQTVKAVLKQSKKQIVQHETQKSQKNKDQILNFLLKHDFQIQKSFLDLHPLNSYLLLCRYIGIQPNRQTKSFFKDSYSMQEVDVKRPILPYMTKIRNQYMKDIYIKARSLERIKSCRQSQKKQIMKNWSQFYELQKIQKLKNDLTSIKLKKQWISKFQYGYSTTWSQISQNVGKFYNYAEFQHKPK